MRTTDLSPRTRFRYGALGAAGIAGLLVLSYLGTRDTHPGASHLHAVFGRAGEGLDTHSAVKVRGVKVGGVSAVRLTPDGRARVTLRLDRGVKAPAGSEAAVVPLSVFGPKYIDLRPGTGEGTGPFLPDGATIAKTADPQELTDVAAPAVHLFDAIAPQDLATILDTLNGGLDGRGEEVGGLIDDSAKLLNATAGRSGDLGRLVDDGGAVLGTAADHAAEIGGIAADLNTVLPAMTGDRAQFERLLAGLDGSARTLDGILRADPGAAGRVVDAASPATGVLYRYRSYFPDLISSSGSVLTQLTGIARAPGPHNTLLSRVTIHIDPSDALCDALPGLCSPIEPAVPNKPDPGAAKGGG
ncbi:MCE family protein [Actinomadura fibrosa]|uniref:MCE family protein n=1 Tax=Actinomadura fibrosa TaxID=111802 RepID=A0ABW2XVN0_9ACTN|nr:MCE family protein [Actinomadura fibrosa]